MVGAGADTQEGWDALVALAEHLACPVFTEAFGARAGFPQDHPLFAGHLSPSRARLREMLSAHDAILAVGAPIFRQYAYEPGPLVEPGTRLALVTDDPAEAQRSPSQLTIVAEPSAVCRGLVERTERARRPAARAVPQARRRSRRRRPARRCAPATSSTCSPSACRPTPSSSRSRPSSRPELHARVPARVPMGFLSAAMGGLGFALPGTIGVRMALPDRPVVAVLGDGSSLYAIQALWSAARYRVGALFLVMANGRYAIMDKLAANTGKPAPWPAFETIDIAAIAARSGLRGDPRSRTTRTCSRASTRCCPGWRSATPRSCSRSPSRPDAQAGRPAGRPRG